MYDFGDSWEHHIALEKVIKDYPHSYVQVIEAGEACPPEDVGGSPGYLAFLTSWHNPSARVAPPDRPEGGLTSQFLYY